MVSETFSDWLRRKMDGRGLSQTDLALEIDQNPSVISRWVRGLQKPNAANARRLADYFDIPRDEVMALLYGDPDQTIYGFSGGRPTLREQALEFISGLPVAIPIHDQEASAGFGQAVIEYAYWEQPRVAGRNIVGLRVRGKSMEPEILDGDTIFIDRDMPAEQGKTVVATIGDQVLVKKLRRRGGQLVLSGKTGDVPAEDAKIEGVVIQLSREVR